MTANSMASFTFCYSCPSTLLLKPAAAAAVKPKLFTNFSSSLPISTYPKSIIHKGSSTYHCSDSRTASVTFSESETETETETETEDEEEEEGGDGLMSFAEASESAPPVKRKRRRYRKQYPGEKKGITEEMRFITMKIRNPGKSKGKDKSESDVSDDEVKNGETVDGADGYESISSGEGNVSGGGKETWQPTIEGFLKYLVDSKLVFSTIERIVDESSDVSYAYFRRTGLERAECISKDLEWYSQQGNVIPEPSNPGISYANYLEELAEKTPPLFLCHFYNIYFSHIAGGQFIAKKASEKLLEEKELEFFKWEGDAEELLRGVREKVNMLAQHWPRDDKNKCLREVTKAFRFLGQIVRLIIIL